MATMDIIKLHGGQPANFLDVGGKQFENFRYIITVDYMTLREDVKF